MNAVVQLLRIWDYKYKYNQSSGERLIDNLIARVE